MGSLGPMCTEHAPTAVVVCDVAISGVREALVELPGVTFTHLPDEGTRVQLDDGDVGEFRTRLHDALTPYGGGLTP
jgi:hypothetical protein